MELVDVVMTVEYWFGIATALALEDVARRALRARVGLGSDSAPADED